MNRPLLIVALLIFTFVSAVEAQKRNEVPVVIEGTELSALQGIAIPGIVGFRLNGNGSWMQIPIQIDERMSKSVPELYQSGNEFEDIEFTIYADPNTFAGPDPDPRL